MKFAYCFYGQPRNYIEGYKNIMAFKNKFNLDIDFYFHTWVSKNNYECSPWRQINKNDLIPDPNIIDNLIRLYKPKAYKFEETKQFNTDIVKNTLAYRESSEVLIGNINNLLSQLYSRCQVTNLISSSPYSKDYNMVILSRFDFCGEINIDPRQLYPEKIYVSNLYSNRYILADNFMIMSVPKLIKLFNVYNELNVYSVNRCTSASELQNSHICSSTDYSSVRRDINIVIDNYSIYIKMKELNETLILNIEEILMGTFIYFNELKNVVKTDLIPNFI